MCSGGTSSSQAPFASKFRVSNERGGGLRFAVPFFAFLAPAHAIRRKGVNAGYHDKGYAHLRGFVAPEVVDVFLRQLWLDLQQARLPLSSFAQTSKLLNKSAVEIYGYRYKPMMSFLWGLTPAMNAVTGLELLPTYSFLRIYQAGDICRVHSDRSACEHSLSLTLGYSDGKVWNFEVGSNQLTEPLPFDETFADERFSSLAMNPGDAVLYKGTEYRHGRTTPNPNRWSAHMFLHWVDRDGPHGACAFDGVELPPGRPEFSFA